MTQNFIGKEVPRPGSACPGTLFLYVRIKRSLEKEWGQRRELPSQEPCEDSSGTPAESLRETRNPEIHNLSRRFDRCLPLLADLS